MRGHRLRSPGSNVITKLRHAPPPPREGFSPLSNLLVVLPQYQQICMSPQATHKGLQIGRNISVLRGSVTYSIDTKITANKATMSWVHFGTCTDANPESHLNISQATMVPDFSVPAANVLMFPSYRFHSSSVGGCHVLQRVHHPAPRFGWRGPLAGTLDETPKSLHTHGSGKAYLNGIAA